MDKYLDKNKVLLVQIYIVLYIYKCLNVFIEIKNSVRYILSYLDYTYRYFSKYIMGLLLLNLEV